MDGPEIITVFDSPYISVKCRDGWYYADRKNVTGIVAIIPVTDDRRLVLVEQFRAAMGGMVIELPAGLAGDVPGETDEALETAARRELQEETGYQAKTWRQVFAGPPSPGMTSEILTFFMATNLRKVDAGGGDASEEITVHAPLIRELPAWLDTQIQAGKSVDLKVYAGLYAISASA